MMPAPATGDADPTSFTSTRAAELSRHVGSLDGGATFAFEGAVSPVCRRSSETGRASAKLRVTGPAVSVEIDATRSPERASVCPRPRRVSHGWVTLG